MNIESYNAPDSIAEAAQLLQGGNATVVAGGTDLTPQTESGVRQFAATLVNIQRIDEMRGIGVMNGRIRIGGLTTVTDILESKLLADEAPVLVDAADRFASSQIRNASSLAGNLCNASPAGDMCIPLLVLDAEVELACWDGESISTRKVSLERFFTGPGKSVMVAGELMTAIEFPRCANRFVAAFLKSGPRPALEISTVSMGLSCSLTDGVISNVRVAIGAVAPTPLRAKRTEAALEGKVLNEATIQLAVETAGEEVSPIDDVRASAWYRKHLTGVYIRRLLNHVNGS